MAIISIALDTLCKKQLKSLLFKPIKKDAESKDEIPLISGL